jgi:hypothetical protein
MDNNNVVVTNEQRIGQALYFLNDGLRPFIEAVMRALHGERYYTCAPASHYLR